MKKVISLTLVIATVLCLTAACTSKSKTEAEQPSYPQMTITINSHKAGSNVDYAARALAVVANDYYGKNMIVNNATSMIDAVRETMNAAADGYTICLVNSSAVITDVLGNSDFDTVEDVRILGIVCTNVANWVCVKKEFAEANSISSLPDLIDYTRNHPEELIISDKVGSNTNMAILLMKEAGLNITSADCGTGGDRVSNFLSGNCDVYVGPYNNIQQYCENGTAVCLCSLSDVRSEFSPDVPCSYEQGIEIYCPTWYYVCGPKDLPEDIVTSLEGLLKHATEDEAFQKTVNGFVATAVYMTAQEAHDWLASEKTRMIGLGMGPGYQK